jgi:hypothetical protein
VVNLAHRDESANVEARLDKETEAVLTRQRTAGAVPALLLCMSCGLGLVTVADALSRSGRGGGQALFWLGIITIVAPATWRAISPTSSRSERIALAVMVGLALYAVKVVHDPFGFTFSDELVHQHNVNEILRTGTLFGRNSLLPITPSYPGLEAAAAALAAMTGLSTFAAGVVLIALARIITSLAIFLLVEKVLDSSRAAALAALLFAGAPNFLYFSAQFSYESLALPMTLVVLYTVAAQRRDSDQQNGRAWRAFGFALVPAIAVTHHVSSYVLAVELLAICVAAVLMTPSPTTRTVQPVAFSYSLPDPNGDDVGFTFSTQSERQGAALNQAWRTATVRPEGAALKYVPWELSHSEEAPPRRVPTWRRSYAPWAITAWTLGWVVAVLVFVGGRTTSYLSPVISRAISLTFKAASNDGPTRLPFQSTEGVVVPTWERIVAIAAVLLVVAWLPFGLRSIWRRIPVGPIVAVLSGGAALYLVTVPLRLIPAAWETAIRASTFVFVGSVTVLAATELGRHRRARQALVSVCTLVVVVGGIISGWPSNLRLSGTYRIAADGTSIDPPSVTAARWTHQTFGAGQRIAAEESDARVFAAIGAQDALAGVYPDVRDLLHAPAVAQWQTDLLRANSINFVAVNRRLASSNALTGYYFAAPTSNAGREYTPEVIRKFDLEPWADRIFDNGTIVLYDTRRLLDDHPPP